MCFRDAEDQHPCFPNSLSSSSSATHAKGLKSVMKADMVPNLSPQRGLSYTLSPASPPPWTLFPSPALFTTWLWEVPKCAPPREHLEPLKSSICGPRANLGALAGIRPSPILWGLCVYSRKRNPSPSLFSEKQIKEEALSGSGCSTFGSFQTTVDTPPRTTLSPSQQRVKTIIGDQEFSFKFWTWQVCPVS